MKKILLLWLLLSALPTLAQSPTFQPIVIGTWQKKQVIGLPKTLDSLRDAISTGTGVPNEFGRSIKRTQADLTGTADASSYLATLVSQPGTVYLTGQLYMNTASINVTASNLNVRGDAVIWLGPNVQQVFAIDGKSNVSVQGITFKRAPGNTNYPMSVLVRASTNIDVSHTICEGVMGPQTFRINYSDASESTICHNIFFNSNSVKGVGSGLFGGAITIQFADGGSLSDNVIDDCVTGALIWGGDANPANGQNNPQNTAGKWAKNITVNNNKITNCTREINNGTGNGAAIFFCSAQNCSAKGNQGYKTGDIIFDIEGCIDVVFEGNFGADGKNAGLATFYGSTRSGFINNKILQYATNGHGFHAFGSTLSVGTILRGNEITTLNPAKAGVFVDADVADFLTIENNIIRSAGNPIETQHVNSLIVRNNKLSGGGPLGIQNTGGVGGFIENNRLDYTGTNPSGAKAIWNVWVSASLPAQYNTIKNNFITGYGLGIHNDASGDNTGRNIITDNITPLVTTPGGAGDLSVIERNRNTLGSYVDGTPPLVTLLAKNDPSVTNARIPTGGAGGFLSGSYPNPGVNSTTLYGMFSNTGGLTYNGTGGFGMPTIASPGTIGGAGQFVQSISRDAQGRATSVVAASLSDAIDAYLNSRPGRVPNTNQILGRDSTNALRYFSIASTSTGTGSATTSPASTTADYSTTGNIISDGGGYYNNDANNSPAAVFDKNINTYYDASDGSSGKYAGRDLGTAYTLNTVRVLPRQQTGQFGATRLNGAQVQYSTDGSNWTTVPGGTISGVTDSNYTQYVVVSFSAVTARYFRVITGANAYGNMAEVELKKL